MTRLVCVMATPRPSPATARRPRPASRLVSSTGVWTGGTSCRGSELGGLQQRTWETDLLTIWLSMKVPEVSVSEEGHYYEKQ